MSGTATDAGLDRLARLLDVHGIVALPRLFSGDLLRRMREDFDRACAAKPTDARGHVQLDGASGERHLAGSEALSRAVTEPLLCALAARHLGAPPRLAYSRGYRVEPMELAPHRAFQPHIDGHGREIKAMILLTDCADDGQRMQYWCGTHGVAWPVRSSRDTLFSDEETARLGTPLSCSGPAGTAFVFDTNAVHRGTRNATARRDVWVVNFTAGERLYPWSGLHAAVERALHPAERVMFRRRDGELDEGAGRLPGELFAAWLGHRRGDLDRALGALDGGALSAQESALATRRPRDLDGFVARRLSRRPAMPASSAHSLPRLPAAATGDALRAWLGEAIERDLHRDLDLPLHPARPDGDRARDTAIGFLRDRADNPVRARVIEAVSNAASRPCAAGAGVARRLALRALEEAAAREPLAGDAGALTTAHRALARDLRDCVEGADTAGLLRATLVYVMGVVAFASWPARLAPLARCYVGLALAEGRRRRT